MTFANKARFYIARKWPVFPVSRDKRPLTRHGYKDATLNPEIIEDWSRRFPDANIAIPTGAATGLAVLDVDGEEGEQSLERLARERGVRFRPTLESSTGRGRHLWYQWLRGLKCSAGKLGPGLDVRAEGGSIVAPPSVHASGREYRWTEVRDIIPFPTSALPVLYPPPPVYPVSPSTSADLSRLVSMVANAPEGQRNHSLNRAAFTAGGWVASRKISLQESQEALVRAAMAAGLTRQEALVTVRSGLRSGQGRPL